jgi:sugar O-acyltransferase (sialic acid O-acetyltransferase NeuD family)
MTQPVIIVGAGGHAAVLADALLAAGVPVLGCVDRDPALHGGSVCGLPVLGDDSVLSHHAPTELALVNGIGGIGAAGDALRRTVQERLTAQGWRFAGVCHPAATVSRFATVAPDAQLLAASVVQPRASIGIGCIVNTGAIVEHDVQLSAWVHVAPRAVVCGDVRVGENSHLGAGCVVRQGVRLAAGSVVGAGAAVVADFEGPGLLVGIPARQVHRTT